MYKNKIPKYLALSLTGMLLVGCSDNSDTGEEPDSEEVSSVDDSNTEEIADTSKNDDEENTDTSNDDSIDESSKENDSSAEKSNNQALTNITNLKMDSSKVLLPTQFPEKEDSSVTTNILINETNQYAVFYMSDQNQPFVKVSGIMYENAEVASKELAKFTEGKTVGEFEDNSTDLGHDILGYAEGAAGTQYFGWSEGNWQFLIKSATQDEMDNANIAKQMVDFLEEHYLPAPDDAGMVYVNYPAGGDKVSVKIEWQDQETVYQLTTADVPNNALEMTTSME